jgi:hypothetical protein
VGPGPASSLTLDKSVWFQEPEIRHNRWSEDHAAVVAPQVGSQSPRDGKPTRSHDHTFTRFEKAPATIGSAPHKATEIDPRHAHYVNDNLAD